MRTSWGPFFCLSGLPWWLSSKESTCNAGDTGNAVSIPGWRRSLGEKSNPLQYSCLKNPMDRGAWRDSGYEGRKKPDTNLRLTTRSAINIRLRTTSLSIRRGTQEVAVTKLSQEGRLETHTENLMMGWGWGKLEPASATLHCCRMCLGQGGGGGVMRYTHIHFSDSPGKFQFSSVAQSFCNPMVCTTTGFPVHHQLLELAQTHVHRVGDTIQPSHPLPSPSPVFNLSQHQGLFRLVSSLHQVAKVLKLQHQSFQWIFTTYFL